MATSLVVLEYDTPEGAGKGLELAQGLQKQLLLQRLDAATVTWPEGKKKPKTRRLRDRTWAGAWDGAFWGMLFGLLFFAPFLGAAFGAGEKKGGKLVGSYAVVGGERDGEKLDKGRFLGSVVTFTADTFSRKDKD